MLMIKQFLWLVHAFHDFFWVVGVENVGQCKNIYGEKQKQEQGSKNNRGSMNKQKCVVTWPCKDETGKMYKNVINGKARNRKTTLAMYDVAGSIEQ